MKKSRRSIHFDHVRQTASLGGQAIVLQSKAWSVLLSIFNAAPDVVSRETLIDDVWSGNYLVGERGLNQALWAIRGQLGDNARDPTYIKTVPGSGYLWLAAPSRKRSQRWQLVSAISVAAGICFAVIATTKNPIGEAGEYTLPGRCEISNRDDVEAYLVNRDVFVDIHNICRLIAQPKGSKVFGAPLVSEDGKYVAFTITEEQSCHLMTVSLQDGRRTEFDSCSIRDN